MSILPDPALRPFSRYGLPLVVLVFYVTAAAGIGYTSDATYATLQYLHGDAIVQSYGGTPFPLWLGFLKLGAVTGLEDVIVAKVFSLVFGCTAVMATFLLGFEITSNRLLAIFAALGTALSSWLLRAAPAGTVFTLVLTVTITTVFFIQRNEYLLATVLAACSLLLSWHGIGLLALVLLDVVINSVNKRRAVHMVGALVLTGAAVLLPWMLVAALFDLAVLPVMPSPDKLAPLDWYTLVVIVGAFGIGAVGFSRPHPDGSDVKNGFLYNITGIILVVALLVGGMGNDQSYSLIAFPFGLAYALRTVQVAVYPAHGERGVYLSSLILLGGVLLLSQLSYAVVVKPEMNREIDESALYVQIGGWLKIHADDVATIATDHYGIVGYYADHPIDPLEHEDDPDFIVTRNPPLEGYRQKFVPQALDPLLGLGEDQPLAVWEKNVHP